MMRHETFLPLKRKIESHHTKNNKKIMGTLPRAAN